MEKFESLFMAAVSSLLTWMLALMVFGIASSLLEIFLAMFLAGIFTTLFFAILLFGPEEGIRIRARGEIQEFSPDEPIGNLMKAMDEDHQKRREEE